jgi:hypothetical protein
MICQMHRLSSKGDVLIEWDPDDAAQVARAQAEFDSLKAAGWAFFATREEFNPADGKVYAGNPPQIKAVSELPVQTKTFKPRARKTVAVPPMQGG